jgi:predicted metal-binding protein
VSKAILFVCQSCHSARPKTRDRPLDGAILGDRLLTLHQEWSQRSQLEIRPVECLWTCRHPCTIALSCPNKSTYVLADIPVVQGSMDETAEAVLYLSQLYVDSENGRIPWKQFPAVLKTDVVACIPPSIPIAVPH